MAPFLRQGVEDTPLRWPSRLARLPGLVDEHSLDQHAGVDLADEDLAGDHDVGALEGVEEGTTGEDGVLEGCEVQVCEDLLGELYGEALHVGMIGR